MILSALAKVACTRANKNKLDMDDDNGIYDNRIDYRIENLLSSIKKMGFKASFFIFKASLTFSKLRKAFIKALILYNFNPKYHI